MDIPSLTIVNVPPQIPHDEEEPAIVLIGQKQAAQSTKTFVGKESLSWRCSTRLSLLVSQRSELVAYDACDHVTNVDLVPPGNALIADNGCRSVLRVLCIIDVSSPKGCAQLLRQWGSKLDVGMTDVEAVS